jgi:hypothetical protein
MLFSMTTQHSDLKESTYFKQTGSQLRRSFVILLLAVLSSYYLWVLYLAAHPQVSTAYRIYYIEKQTLYWAKENSRLDWPDTGFINTSNSSPYLSRQGWASKASEDGRELVHQGSVFFNLAPNANGSVRVSVFLSHSITEPVYASLDGNKQVRLMPRGINRLEATLPAMHYSEELPIHQIQFETTASLNVNKIAITEST